MNLDSAIRRARSDDADALSSLFSESRRKALPDLPERYSADQIFRWMVGEVLSKQTVWVIESGGKVAGFLALHEEDLSHLYIAPRFLRKGLGGRLLCLAQRTSPLLRLFAFQKNEPAIRFYLKHGFHVLGYGDGSQNEEREPDVQMEWKRETKRRAPAGASREFHLSLGVGSLDESIAFFTHVLGAEVSHRDPSGYVNLDVHGCQLTLKACAETQPGLPHFHFGVNFRLAEFERIAEHAMQVASKSIVMPPTMVEAGTSMERAKMYPKCPTGYLIELKGYA